MKYEQLSIDDICPQGGDPANDCADCVYSADYHLVNGECVHRKHDPEEIRFGKPEEPKR